MVKTKPPTPEGAVFLIDKPTEPVVRKISATAYEKTIRPRKELSQKQKENLERLIERNKARAVERRAAAAVEVPESIPEDKVLVKVMPKRPYCRKEKPKNEIVEPTPEPSPAPSEADTESEVERPIRRPRPPKSRAKKEPAKPKKYRYETETTSQDDWSDGSSDSECEENRLQKYKHKAEKRIETVQQIDAKLKKLNGGTYAQRNLTLF